MLPLSQEVGFINRSFFSSILRLNLKPQEFSNPKSKIYLSYVSQGKDIQPFDIKGYGFAIHR